MFIKTPRTGLVGFVGSVTLDVFAALQGVLSLGSKHDCSFDLQLGGGAVNAARQAQRLLPHAALFAFVGSDDLSEVVAQKIRHQFPNHVIVPALDETRISVLFDGTCFTTRPALSVTQLPTESLAMLSTCEVVVFAPATPADSQFLLEAMKSLPDDSHVILQLSTSQLKDRDSAVKLMGAADTVVMNEGEACAFAGRSSPMAAMQTVYQACRGDLIVTSTTGVRAIIDAEEISQPAFRVDDVELTVGAGDVFVGTFAAGLALGRSAKRCLSIALGAAALHVMGASCPTELDDIVDEITAANGTAKPVRPDAGHLEISTARRGGIANSVTARR